MQWSGLKSRLQELHDPLYSERKLSVFMLRDDLLHPEISGNKWRKLKYHLLGASKDKYTTLVSMGGPQSNHISALAVAGKKFGFKTMGLIRGYEVYRNYPTLKSAAQQGMHISFLNRTEYQQIENHYLDALEKEIGLFYFIPTGGAGIRGIQGCIEIAADIHPQSTHLALACGTGSTLTGILLGASNTVKVIGFPVMKNGGFIHQEIDQALALFTRNFQSLPSYHLELDFHFGGFGKLSTALVDFINAFYARHHIALDGVYTGKMMYGLNQQIQAGYFPPGSVITAIHTGGVQGNNGLIDRYDIQLPVN